MSNRITVRIEGPDPSQEHVSLAAFLQQLGALRAALKKSEEVVSGRTTIDWQVVALSHSSPATVTIEPVRTEAASETLPDNRSEVVGRFFGYLRSLSHDQAPPELDRAALVAFQELVAPVNQHKLRTWISNGTDPSPVEVRGSVDAVIASLLAPTMKAEGDVKGRLEFLNIHAERNVFRVYSPVIPRWVECHFPDLTLPTAKDAVGSKVRVFGELTYRTRDPYPQSIEVKQIEVLPEDGKLPRLADLRGTMPNATGSLLSEEFVRDLRSE